MFLSYFSIVSANIFEANDPGEVENFLEHDQAQYRALLFYDDADDDQSTNAEIDKIMSIFDNPDDPEFRGEPWIREISTGANLMRIDIHKSSLSSVVTQYEVSDPPKIIVFDKTKIIVEETIGRPTYPKIKAEVNDQNIAPPPSPPNPIEPSPPKPIESPQTKPIEPSQPVSTALEPPIEKPSSPPPISIPSTHPSLPSQPPSPPLINYIPPPRPTPPRPSVAEGKCSDAVATAKLAADRASKAVDEISSRYEEYWEHMHEEEDTMRSKTPSHCRLYQRLHSVSETGSR